MNTYSIYKKSPATRWYKIYSKLSFERVDNIFSNIEDQGGSFNRNDLTCSYYEDGDLIEYKTEKE